MARMKNWQPTVSYRPVKDFEVDIGGTSYSHGEGNFWITLYRGPDNEERTRLTLTSEDRKKAMALRDALNDWLNEMKEEGQ